MENSDVTTLYEIWGEFKEGMEFVETGYTELGARDRISVLNKSYKDVNHWEIRRSVQEGTSEVSPLIQIWYS